VRPLSRVFKNLILLWIATIAQLSWADGCKTPLAALSANSDGEPVSLDAQIKQMASLYSLVVDNKVPREVFQTLLSQLAHREGRVEIDLYREIELLADSPTESNAKREEQRAQREVEQSRLYEGLEPYLARIGNEHRRIIEEEVIRRGLIKPLSTGEVEFQFRGEHTFLVGDERTWGVDEGKTRNVSFKPGDDFAIGQVPVTQFLYLLAALGSEEKGVDPTPSQFKEGVGAVVLRLGDRKYHFNPNHPVESVYYAEAEAHAIRVSSLTGVPHGLPSELKWEFANRAGSKLKYHFGDDGNLLPKYGWFDEISEGQTHEVGQLLENDYHLYDTHGNVWEWTSSLSEEYRVVRGGSWRADALILRSAYRAGYGPSLHSGGLGFRLERQSASNTHPFYTFTLGVPKPEATPGSSTSLVFRNRQ
jgi:hypothetical protein